MIDANERAFPVSVSYSDYNPQVLIPTGGLTIRQHFAAMAMIGLVSQQAPVDRIINEGNQALTKQLAEASVILADALIKELNKNQTT